MGVGGEGRVLVLPRRCEGLREREGERERGGVRGWGGEREGGGGREGQKKGFLMSDEIRFLGLAWSTFGACELGKVERPDALIIIHFYS